MKLKTKEDKAIFECYQRLFANSEPKGDFKELCENAIINEQGQKEIDFMAYEIDEIVYNKIVEDVIKEFKISKLLHAPFRVTIALGCSPKFKKSLIEEIDEKNTKKHGELCEECKIFKTYCRCEKN